MIIYPIKYIENNIIFNKNGEVFAYYELLPFNYSFLSKREKIEVNNNFHQLVSQYRNGQIHALQIASESSVKATQDRSKKCVTGKLKEVAYEIIDMQTEALIDMVGVNEIDYRYFLGFKLFLNDEQINIKNILETGYMSLCNFINDVNNKLMGDFIKISNSEIERYKKIEKLLENKISRRFKVKRINENDFGYLLEHIYGAKGTAYDDYSYNLPKIKEKQETFIKYYDVIRPIRCLIDEHQRYIKITRDDSIVYVAYMTINSVGELDFPSSEIFYYQQQQFGFPVDTSINIEVIPNKRALTTVRNKKKELNDLDNNAWQSENETDKSVLGAMEAVDELEERLNDTKESMYKVSYVIRIVADDLEELKLRCNQVSDFYDDMDIKLVRPFGDMLGLHEEFILSSKRYLNDYVQYVTADFLSGLGFGTSQKLGEDYGIYIGYSVETGNNVYIQPALASQGVKGSVTNALASAFTGALGGGKSFTNNLIIYYAVLFGAKAVVLDPKAERGGWKEALSEIKEEINIVNLKSSKENQGLLDPFIIMKNIKEAESLAIDVLTFLTGISSRDGTKFPVLRKAIRSVTQSKTRGLLKVIDELRKENTPVSLGIANHIESFADYNFANLLFSDGYRNIDNAITLDKQLNIIQVADLVLPDKDSDFESYTTIELLSVCMLIVISTFSLNFIHSDRTVFKVVDLDEAWAFLNVAQGVALSNKLVRAGRAMNAGVYFVTQSAGDVSNEVLKNNIGLKFAFRSNDENEIKQTLEFFGLDSEDKENQIQLRDLENGQCLFQDLYGRVGVIQVHPIFEELFKAFDTRPPIQRSEL